MPSSVRGSPHSDLPERFLGNEGANAPEVDPNKSPALLPGRFNWQSPNSLSSQYTEDKRFSDTAATVDKRQTGNDGEPKRLWGLRKRWWIALSLAFLLVIGVGLGVGLGIGLAKNGNQNDARVEQPVVPATPAIRSVDVMRDTGIAAVMQSDGTGLLLYYQLPNASLVQDAYQLSSITEGRLNLSSASRQRSLLTTPNITDGSPIAIVTFSGQKHLFYVDGTNSIRNIVDEGRGWGPASYLSSEQKLINSSALERQKMRPNSVSLAACYFDEVGVRVYHGTDSGTGLTGVGIISKDEWASQRPRFNNTYRTWTRFDADARAGIACSGQYSNGTKLQDVYMKGSQNDVFYLRESLAATDLVSESNLRTMTQYHIADFGAIAAATNVNAQKEDPNTRTVIFYRGSDGTMKRVRFNMPGNQNGVPTSTGIRIGQNTKLASVWPDDDGSLVFFEGAVGKIYVNRFNEDGQVVANTTIAV
ncbi:Hypothetical protein D9617_6g096020 [Elsinoe fawcettii]|nr:Hypothetical protein D9617_6g096020 [Elsinoe fawcettii]